ncbi:MFS transporter [Gordonia sp. TBRC 11910]|uniref:MFS transporter n=1 Tax=Gordonia asplenii TaxID=2725283 RepID=A0A848KXZ7_9ACTN|nr:MFS transporter [Gordonia asplenii]NMO01725.1 MFS transporter [Gordonia asplenii]
MSSIGDTTADPSELPGEVTTEAYRKRFQIRLIVVLVAGMLLDGYILGIIGPITSTIEHEVAGMTTAWIGLEAASALIGIMIGSPIGGWLADKLGRKPLLFWDVSLFTIASAAQFFVETPTELFLVRLAMGIAVGVEYAVGWPLLAEFAPAHLRGRLLGCTIIAWYLGFCVAFVVGYYLDQAGVSWNIILGTSTPIAILILLGRIGLPESPRWLWSKGRTADAKGIVGRYLDTDYMTDMVKAKSGGPAGSFAMLFSPSIWRSTVFMAGFWACAVTPYFAIATFANDLLTGFGLTGLLGGISLSVFALIGVIVTTLIVDKVRRRTLTVPTQWIAGALLVIIGLWAGAPPVVMLLLFLAFSFVNAMYNVMTTVYPSEVFPTEVRGIGTGFSAAVSRLGAAAGLFLIPISLEHLGFSTTMFIAAVIAFAGAALSQVLAPETGGKSLSEMAENFSH